LIVDNDDDIIDLTMDDISVDLTPKSRSKIQRARSDLSESPEPRRGKGRGRAPEKRKDHQNGQVPSDAIIATWRKGDDNLEPSTKMLALINLLKESDSSGDKTICYSQWTSMLDLIEILFSRYGIQSLRYDGKMDRAARDSTLTTFMKMGGPKVILIRMSIKS